MKTSTLIKTLTLFLAGGVLSSYAAPANPMDSAVADKCNLSAAKMCNIDTIITDTNWHWVFSDSTDATKPLPSTDLSAWLRQNGNWSVRYPNTDSVELATNGARPLGGANNTMLIFPYKMNDGAISIELRMSATAGLNSGLQWHSWCNTNKPSSTGNFSATGDGLWDACGPTVYVCGPQSDQGSSYSGDMYNTCGNSILNSSRQVTNNAYGTVITANSSGCRTFANLPTPAWVRETVRFHGDTAWTYLGKGGNPTLGTLPDGKDSLCNEIVFSAAGNSAGMAPGTTSAQQTAWQTAPGIMAWQYESATVVEWKHVKIKNLDSAVATGPVSLHSSIASHGTSFLAVQSGMGSFSFNTNEKGNFAVKIIDVDGNVIKMLHGSGETHQVVNLGRTGVYFVQLSSARNLFTQKVVVY